MTLNARQETILIIRTEQAYQETKRRARAAGQALDYGLEDLRALVVNNLGERHCPYCKGPVTVENFALDHKNPIERTGSYIFHNLAIVCEDCAVAKSCLDYIEFKELMELVRTWSAPVQKHFRFQLRVGGSQIPPLRVRWPAGWPRHDFLPSESCASPRSRRPAASFKLTAEHAAPAERAQK